MVGTWLVIPCFNEAARLDPRQVGELLAESDIGLVMVNDGSTDNTAERLDELISAYPGRIQMLRMVRNVGKAESVRRGMNHAHALGARVTGYLDADFATPAKQMLALVDKLSASPDCQVLLGARWLHLGADIRRSSLRHYAGRVFATWASMVLRMPVYDTQCGAKLFRVTDNLLAALDEPFRSRWAFDVELIGRLRAGVTGQGYGMAAFLEVPLVTWTDVSGSKISPVEMIRATLELLPIALALRRMRR